MGRKYLFSQLSFMGGMVLVGLMLGLISSQAQASPAALSWEKVNVNGFGNPYNQQIPALEAFDGHLYAGVWNGELATAEIWRTSSGDEWDQVDDRAVNGAADLVVFNGSIFAGSWDGYIWSSPNGITWTEVITGGFDGSGQGIAHFSVFSDTLYAGTWYAGAEIWRTTDGVEWLPFVEDGLGDIDNGGLPSSEIFNGLLYFGVGNWTEGAQVWQTDGITVTVIMTGGFGITENQAVSSMAVFGNMLYAGLENPHDIQVWRTADGTTWEQVVNGLGYPDQGSNINSLELYRDRLYLVVQNNLVGLGVWQTSNGTDWYQVAYGGFGNVYNQLSYWDNATTQFNGQLYVATNNFAGGGEIWRLTGYYPVNIPLLFRGY